MMVLLQFFGITVAMTVLIYVFGMTLMPFYIKNHDDSSHMYFAPIFGFATWMVITVAGGFFLPYNAAYIIVCTILALIWIIYRRHTLTLPKNSLFYISFFLTAILGSVLAYIVFPTLKDGIMTFHNADYDYTRCAIIKAITVYGLPPVNPWVADNGVPVPMAYYFGWSAWAAQFSILTGCDSLFTECAMYAVSFTACTLGVLGTCLFYCSFKKKIATILFFLFYFSCGIWFTLQKFLPADFLYRIYPDDKFIGFWPIVENYIWAPHHSFAAANVVVLVLLIQLVFSSKGVEDKLRFAILTGIMAAAASLSSVYAGCMALTFLAIVFLPFFVTKSGIRLLKDNWLFIAVALGTTLMFTFSYLHYLLSYPGETLPLQFGSIPGFGEQKSVMDWVMYFGNLYILVFPIRLGVAYIAGLAGVLSSGVLTKNFTKCVPSLYVLVSLLMVGVLHSTFYSNDFGWRSIIPAHYLLVVGAVFWVTQKIDTILVCPNKLQRKIAGCAMAAFLLIPIITYWDNIYIFSSVKMDKKFATDLTNAIKGWDVVKANTGSKDMVLSRPDGGMAYAGVINNGWTTNVFWALFSERFSPMGDVIFGKCYSEYYGWDKIWERRSKIIDIFDGNPSLQDANYLADILRVKAILVTPYDGLWYDSGELGKRYARVITGKGYRVYLTSKNNE